jgi:hypothetical protein
MKPSNIAMEMKMERTAGRSAMASLEGIHKSSTIAACLIVWAKSG